MRENLAAIERQEKGTPHGGIDHQALLSAPIVPKHYAVHPQLYQMIRYRVLIRGNQFHQPVEFFRFQIKVFQGILKAADKRSGVKAGNAQRTDHIPVRVGLDLPLGLFIAGWVVRIRGLIIIKAIPSVA